jgi:hypothetical protein
MLPRQKTALRFFHLHLIYLNINTIGMTLIRIFIVVSWTFFFDDYFKCTFIKGNEMKAVKSTSFQQIGTEKADNLK